MWPYLQGGLYSETAFYTGLSVFENRLQVWESLSIFTQVVRLAWLYTNGLVKTVVLLA